MNNIPKNLCLYRKLYGREMQNNINGRGDETRWAFPKDVQIEANTRYEIWYTRRESADTSDSSVYYTVHYIEIY